MRPSQAKARESAFVAQFYRFGGTKVHADRSAIQWIGPLKTNGFKFLSQHVVIKISWVDRYPWFILGPSFIKISLSRCSLRNDKEAEGFFARGAPFGMTMRSESVPPCHYEHPSFVISSDSEKSMRAKRVRAALPHENRTRPFWNLCSDQHMNLVFLKLDSLSEYGVG